MKIVLFKARALPSAPKLIAVGVVALLWLGTVRGGATGLTNAWPVMARYLPASVQSAYAGSLSCQGCHTEEYRLWAASHHGQAERPVQFPADQAAFVPARSFIHGSETNAIAFTNGVFQVRTLGLSGQEETFAVERVIGVDPLRQFLVPFPGGRLQTLEASYDPRTNEWFDSFGAEARQPGEWGHWTGRGMNWNSMCAVCHNTRVQKNYDATNDAYHTAMAGPTVGCEACHGPLKAHDEWQKKWGKTGAADPTVAKMSHTQIMETCATCHSRRDDLTGDFIPGEPFLDHYNLEIAGTEDNYYPDGQIRDEDYEYASFLSSRMAARGVYCLDCHNPHSYKIILPGNWLCLRCHGAGSTVAPVINPVTHSHHKVYGFDTNGVAVTVKLAGYDSKAVAETGGECINCHMPQTEYMQRHWRHDHGFTLPDPLLTKQFGIPNACNRCHQDKSTDWALGASEKWYGAALDGPRRQRAQTFARANAGDATAINPLLDVLRGDEPSFWKAAAENALASWGSEPKVISALEQHLSDTNALVRTKAAQALNLAANGADPEVQASLRQALQDPVRSVRLAAAWDLVRDLEPGSSMAIELERSLNEGADQPAGQLQLGLFEFARGNASAGLAHEEKAVQWDPFSAPARRELAVAYSSLNRTLDAVKALQAAVRLAPTNADYQFELGLAWNEAGDLAQAQSAFATTVKLAPLYARAWYNLGLARSTAGDLSGAIEALLQAEAADPADPRAPYARATILARQGKEAEARAALRRALAIQPDFPPALELMRRLRD